jgi:hypothetical protein
VWWGEERVRKAREGGDTEWAEDRRGVELQPLDSAAASGTSLSARTSHILRNIACAFDVACGRWVDDEVGRAHQWPAWTTGGIALGVSRNGGWEW